MDHNVQLTEAEVVVSKQLILVSYQFIFIENLASECWIGDITQPAHDFEGP